MKYHKPRKQALFVWWMVTFFIALFLCTVISFVFTVFSMVWFIGVFVVLALFCFFFSVYFPLKLKKAAFTFDKENLIIYSGVFFTNVSYIRLENVQFVTKSTDILGKLFNISSVYVWTAGGREAVFGLSGQEADRVMQKLAGVIRQENSKTVTK